MTESDLTRDLKAVLMARLPRPCWVTKHADNFTSGIPDMSADHSGGTDWVELKLIRTTSTPKREIADGKHASQLAQMLMKERCGRRVAYVVWSIHRKGGGVSTTIWLPSALKSRFDAGEAYPLAPAVPVSWPSTSRLEEVVRARGGAALIAPFSEGHDFVARYLRGD